VLSRPDRGLLQRLGSSVVDHSATLGAGSRNVTVVCPLAPSILT